MVDQFKNKALFAVLKIFVEQFKNKILNYLQNLYLSYSKDVLYCNIVLVINIAPVYLKTCSYQRIYKWFILTINYLFASSFCQSMKSQL